MDQIDEYEQGERVRAWLRNNGSSLIGGIAIGLALLFGWKWWQGQGDVKKHEAATEYLAFTKALEAGEDDKAIAHLTVLQTQYPKLPYAALAALNRAADLHKAGKHDDALKALQAVSGEGMDPGLVALAKLRAARILVDAGKAEDALARLDADVEKAFPSVSAEIRGDAELALGRRDAARAAYEKALASLDVAAPTRPMIELKLTEAGGTPSAQPEA
jgi:predicted negative regulator of RcsB-dependent stress response